MKNLYKLLATQNEKKKKYFKDALFWGKKIKMMARDILPVSKLLLFGSVVSGKYRPDSDFDVLIVTNKIIPNIFEQEKIKIKILNFFPNNPFEIHLINQTQFENWYKRFIKKDYLEV